MLNTISLLFCIIISSVTAQYQNNVCSSLQSYFNISTNPNCWYDPDLNTTPKKLAQNNGFILEEHTVRTEDGYILPTYRLKSPNGLYGKEVIYLQHGMTADSSCFMLNKDNSIAFFLARQGFDVWLGNARSCDSCKHEYLTTDDSKYWDFSFHEIALYDLSANFKYITSKTKRKIFYIGHSMGGTTLGIYASMRPIEAKQYIKHAILIAPSFYMRHTRGLTSLGLINRIYPLLAYLPLVNYNVILGTNSFELQVFRRTCFTSMENANFCLTLIEELGGKAAYPIEPEKLPFIFAAIKGTSSKCQLHYIQGIRKGTFRMFDYGLEENMVRYHRGAPPDYNLTDITISLSLIYGRTDNVATMEDIIYAFEKFRKPNWAIYEMPHNHHEFLFSKLAKTTILPLLLRIINKNMEK